MEKLLTLRHCSHPVDEDCVVFCDRQANLLMECASSQLVRIYEPDNGLHFVWLNKTTSFEAPEFTRVFFLEDEEPITAFEDVHLIQPNEVFCYAGQAYYLAENKKGTLCIRQVDIYCSQTVLEQISYYDFQPESVDEIYMVKIYSIGQIKQFAFAVWVVERPSTKFHIPVFDKDGAKLDDLLESGLYLEERMSVNDIFSQHGRTFKLLQDESKKLCLSECTRLQSLERAREQEVVSQPKTLKAKCISLRQR